MTRQVSVEAGTTNDTDHAKTPAKKTPANPFSGSSLVPMLVAGLVLTLVGMIVAVVLS